jgi:hypothetical protein
MASAMVGCPRPDVLPRHAGRFTATIPPTASEEIQTLAGPIGPWRLSVAPMMDWTDSVLTH